MRGNLLEVIATLDGTPDGDPYEVEPTIFMRKPWTAYSEAVVLNEDAVNGVAPSAPDFTYLLEVDLAKEVIRVWSEWRGGAVPTSEQATQAVIFYGEHDAYQRSGWVALPGRIWLPVDGDRPPGPVLGDL